MLLKIVVGIKQYQNYIQMKYMEAHKELFQLKKARIQLMVM